MGIGGFVMCNLAQKRTDDTWVRKEKSEIRKEKSASKREQKQSTFDYAECEQIQDDKVGLKEKAEVRKETCEAWWAKANKSACDGAFDERVYANVGFTRETSFPSINDVQMI